MLEIDPKYERKLAKPLISKALRNIKENKAHDLKVMVEVRSSSQDLISVLNALFGDPLGFDHGGAAFR